MNLAQFPDEIARVHSELLKSDQACRHWQSQVDGMTLVIDYQVAFDKSLNNENQRKAEKGKLMQADEMETAIETLQISLDQKAARQIELEQVRNQFSVAKLAERRAIAELEAQ
jgi:hypothetical protein